METEDGIFEVEKCDSCLFDEKQEKVIKGRRSGNSHLRVGGCPWKGQAFAEYAPEEEIIAGMVDVGRDATYSKGEAEQKLEEARLNDEGLDRSEMDDFLHGQDKPPLIQTRCLYLDVCHFTINVACDRPHPFDV